MFGFIVAAVEGVKAVESGVSAVSGALHGSNPKDAQRAAAAKAALAKALAGSLADAQWILSQRFGSATAYGKQQYDFAWQTLVQQNPALAAEALKTGQSADAYNTSPTVRSQLAAEWNSLVAKIRQDVGTTVQQLGAGGTTAAASAVDPSTGYATLPLSSKTMWTIAIVALALAAIFFLARKRAA